MYLAFTRIFDEQTVEMLDRIQLQAHNRFGLEPGEYFIHDLHPISLAQGPEIYFVVEAGKSHQILLTARWAGESSQVQLSPAHLQSALAEAALSLLRTRLNETLVRERLAQRQQQVRQAHLTLPSR